MSRRYVYEQFALAEHFAQDRKQPLMAFLVLHHLLLQRGQPPRVGDTPTASDVTGATATTAAPTPANPRGPGERSTAHTPREHTAVLAPLLGPSLKVEEAMARVRAAELLLWGEHVCHRAREREEGLLSTPPRTRDEGEHGAEGETRGSSAGTGADNTRPPLTRAGSHEAANLAHDLLTPLFTDGAGFVGRGASRTGPLTGGVQGSPYFTPPGSATSVVAVSMLPEAAFTSDLLHRCGEGGAGDGHAVGGVRCVFAATPAYQRRLRRRRRRRRGDDEADDGCTTLASDSTDDGADAEEGVGEEGVPVAILLKAYVLLAHVERRGARTMPSLRRALAILLAAEQWMAGVFSSANIGEDEQRLSRALHSRFVTFQAHPTPLSGSVGSTAFFHVRGGATASATSGCLDLRSLRTFMQKPGDGDGTEGPEGSLAPAVAAWWDALRRLFQANVAAALRVCKALLHTELSHIHNSIASNILSQGVPSLGAYMASAVSGGSAGGGSVQPFSSNAPATPVAAAPAPLELRARLRELAASVRALRLYTEYFTSLRSYLLRQPPAGHAAACSANGRSDDPNLPEPQQQHQQGEWSLLDSTTEATRQTLVACAESLAFFRAQALLLQQETGLNETDVEVRAQWGRLSIGEDTAGGSGEGPPDEDAMVTLARHLAECTELFSSPCTSGSPLRCTDPCAASDEFSLLRGLFLATDMVLPAGVRTAAAAAAATMAAAPTRPATTTAEAEEAREETGVASREKCLPCVHWMTAGVRNALAQYAALRAVVSHPRQPVHTSRAAAVSHAAHHSAGSVGTGPGAGGRTSTEESTAHEGKEVPAAWTTSRAPSPLREQVADVERALRALLESVEREGVLLARTQTGGGSPAAPTVASIKTEAAEDGGGGGAGHTHRRAYVRSVLFCSPFTQAHVLVQIKVAALLTAAGAALTNLHYVVAVGHLAEVVNLMNVFARYFGGRSGAVSGGGSNAERSERSRGAIAGGGLMPPSLPAATSTASHSVTPSASPASAGGGSIVNHRLKIELHLLIAALAMHLSVRDITPIIDGQQQWAHRLRQRRRPLPSAPHTTVADSAGHRGTHALAQPDDDTAVTGSLVESVPYFEAYTIAGSDSGGGGGGAAVEEVRADVGLPYFHLQAAEELYYASPAAAAAAGLGLHALGSSGSPGAHRAASPLLLSIKLMKAMAMYQVAADGKRVTLTRAPHPQNPRGGGVGEEQQEEAGARDSDSGDTHGEADGRRWRSGGAVFTTSDTSARQRDRCSGAVGEVLERLTESYAGVTDGPALATPVVPPASPQHGEVELDAGPHATTAPPSPAPAAPPPSSAWSRPNVALFHLLRALHALTESKDEAACEAHLRRFLLLSKAELGVHSAFVADGLQLLASARARHTSFNVPPPQQQQQQPYAHHRHTRGSDEHGCRYDGASGGEDMERGDRHLSSPHARVGRDEDEWQRATALARHASQRYNGLALLRLLAATSTTAVGEDDAHRGHGESGRAALATAVSPDTQPALAAQAVADAGLPRKVCEKGEEWEAYTRMQEWRRLQLRTLAGGGRRQGVAAGPGSRAPSEVAARQFLSVLTFLPHTRAYRKLE